MRAPPTRPAGTPGGREPEEAEAGTLPLGFEALDRFMPMHVIVAADGLIRRVGPTWLRLRPRGELIGRAFLEVFELRRPTGIQNVTELPNRDGGRFSTAFRKGARGSFKGLAVHLGPEAGLLANLSFGISVLEAVETYDLSAKDFAETDLAVEMLYLVEAKSAAMAESKKLNQRLRSAKVAAEEQAFTDTLTGLKNRRAMNHVLMQLRSARIPFGLLHVDLDYFKQVNDTYGHAAGDEVLQSVARVLVSETRREDTVARAGGDEFVLILRDLADVSQLHEIAHRIISSLERPIPYNGKMCRISASVGLTTSEIRPGASIDQLLEDVDGALYASKRAGRGRCTVVELDRLRE
ncbi:GGDEF domain-containing protein [Tropicimonas isoalkanivorans]|uniref:Diguanylate cyclase (GGDEF) domain-containing protein n=1 Tax=Tropicimonas isoalkanivorans TaxID=441112 RepID=A0A1I1LAK6_9RHOB|nr:GGDEF domain-containing protein [Tropicimonas isoalkanivorans]SFC70036.1 diguanylate cyclase (GGDEF) domain-containing protein [Tropicimonas isoalkanivorans]